MSIFNRRFAALEGNSTLKGWADNEGVRALFDQWHLPGTVPDNSDTPRLRIGIRDKYLNFYVDGQSVAKLRVDAKGNPVAEVHWKYVKGIPSGKTSDDRPNRDYILIRDGEITPSAVATWIATARTYRSPEKAFVEGLIAANPGVIDLEMGLPANSQTKSAPRMDLVLVQMNEGQPEIAFWEAKCSNNGELRSNSEFVKGKTRKDDKGPHVIGQVLRYQEWLTTDDGAQRVATGYQNAAKILASLAEIFGKGETDAVRIWKETAKAPPRIITSPGIVVGNYDACCETDKDPFVDMADSFQKHEDRLKAHAIKVQSMAKDDNHALDYLPETKIRSSIV